MLSIQKYINSPLNTNFQAKVTDEATDEVYHHAGKAKPFNDKADRILLELDENYEDKSFHFERAECEQMCKALQIEYNSSVSTIDSITSPPPGNESPSFFTCEDYIPELIDTIDCDDGVEREYFLRCVVLGAKDTGKHTLINCNFNQETKRNSLDRNDSDFLIKSSVQGNTTKKYHFWLRTLGEESVTKDALWRTYYKWANAFVFVYDTTNKESFEALKQEVSKILQVVPRENFFGVLVGTKSDQHSERAVDYEDIISFKSSYNFSHLIETNCFTERDAPQLLQRLNRKLKLTFEAL